MGDSRTYIRVHDGMEEHPKIEGLSDAAFRALHRCWGYCSRNKTDGRLTDAAWKNRAKTPSVRRELVDAGLVHLPGFECPHPPEDCPPVTAGHVQMHDYLDWQRSAAEIEELSRKRAEAGSRGGRARASARASAKQTPQHLDGKSVADTETETKSSLRSDVAPHAATGNGQPKSRGTRLPDDFAITDEMRQWARALGFADQRIDAITEAFRDFWRGKSGAGGVKADWPATWRNWLRREAEERPPRPTVSTGGGLRSWEM